MGCSPALPISVSIDLTKVRKYIIYKGEIVQPFCPLENNDIKKTTNLSITPNYTFSFQLSNWTRII